MSHREPPPPPPPTPPSHSKSPSVPAFKASPLPPPPPPGAKPKGVDNDNLQAARDLTEIASAASSVGGLDGDIDLDFESDIELDLDWDLVPTVVTGRETDDARSTELPEENEPMLDAWDELGDLDGDEDELADFELETSPHPDGPPPTPTHAFAPQPLSTTVSQELELIAMEDSSPPPPPAHATTEMDLLEHATPHGEEDSGQALLSVSLKGHDVDRGLPEQVDARPSADATTALPRTTLPATLTERDPCTESDWNSTSFEREVSNEGAALGSSDRAQTVADLSTHDATLAREMPSQRSESAPIDSGDSGDSGDLRTRSSPEESQTSSSISELNSDDPSQTTNPGSETLRGLDTTHLFPPLVERPQREPLSARAGFGRSALGESARLSRKEMRPKSDEGFRLSGASMTFGRLVLDPLNASPERLAGSSNAVTTSPRNTDTRTDKRELALGCLAAVLAGTGVVLFALKFV